MGNRSVSDIKLDIADVKYRIVHLEDEVCLANTDLTILETELEEAESRDAPGG